MSSRKFTLGKEERLKSRKLIEGLFREGKNFMLFPFRVYYTPGPALQAGFGASSRNFKKAVDRNRIKRLTREAYRLQAGAFRDHLEAKGGQFILFFIYTGKELPDYDTVKKKMGLILQRLIKETGG